MTFVHSFILPIQEPRFSLTYFIRQSQNCFPPSSRGFALHFYPCSVLARTVLDLGQAQQIEQIDCNALFYPV